MPRLHSRIYVHFLGVLLVVGVAASVVFALGTRGAFIREVTERVGRHVASLVEEELADPTALARRLHQIQRDLDVDVTVRDLDGRVIAAVGSELPAPTGPEVTRLRAGGVVAHGGRHWVAAAPVRDVGSRRVTAAVSLAPHHRLDWSMLLRPVLGVALVLVVVALATAPLARRISRPVARLTEAARRLGRGDLAYRVPLATRRAWRRRRGEDELERLTEAFNDMADRVERLVRGEKELLANVSHELRSPLARMRVALELVPRHPENIGRLRDIQTDLTELEQLIDDVLVTARLEARGLPVHLGPVEAGELLRQLAERAGRDPVTAATIVEAAPGPAVHLVADEALLKRAVWNLVENAAKYGAPPVVLDAQRTGDDVELRVTDAGDGIPADERERVLAPFYRGRTRTSGERPPGAGLGLALARRVAEVHGGSIAITAAGVADGREHGCRVVLTLPATGPGRYDGDASKEVPHEPTSGR